MEEAEWPSWPTLPVAHGSVVLRRYLDSDVLMVMDLATDPYVPLVGSLDANANHEQAQAFIDRQRGRLEERIGFAFAAAEADTDDAVGGAGLWLNSFGEGRATAGYSIAPSSRGRGFATNALIAVTNFAWTIPQLHRVELYIEPWNVGSKELPRRLGICSKGCFEVIRRLMGAGVTCCCMRQSGQVRLHGSRDSQVTHLAFCE